MPQILHNVLNLQDWYNRMSSHEPIAANTLYVMFSEDRRGRGG